MAAIATCRKVVLYVHGVYCALSFDFASFFSQIMFLPHAMESLIIFTCLDHERKKPTCQTWTLLKRRLEESCPWEDEDDLASG